MHPRSKKNYENVFSDFVFQTFPSFKVIHYLLPKFLTLKHDSEMAFHCFGDTIMIDLWPVSLFQVLYLYLSEMQKLGWDGFKPVEIIKQN